MSLRQSRRMFLLTLSSAFLKGCGLLPTAAEVSFDSVLYLSGRSAMFPSFIGGEMTKQVVLGAAGSGLWDLLKSIREYWRNIFLSEKEKDEKNEKQLLIETANEAGLDKFLVMQAAKLYGYSFIRKHIQDGVRFWYQDKTESSAVNSFSFSIKNTSYSRNSGQIVFGIEDYYTASQEMSYSSPVFGLEPGQQFIHSETVNQKHLPRAGLKRVRILQQPDNTDVKTTNLFILAMEPK